MLFTQLRPAIRRSFSTKLLKNNISSKSQKNIITITEAAESRLKKLYAKSDDKLLRLTLKKKGCSGLSSSMDFTDKKSQYDEVVEQNGVKVVVDSKAVMSLLGTEMDYIEDDLHSQFVFKNPNAKDLCGCGESFSV